MGRADHPSMLPTFIPDERVGDDPVEPNPREGREPEPVRRNDETRR